MIKTVSTKALSRSLPCRAAVCSHAPAITRGLATTVDTIQKDPVELDKITTLSNGIRVATEALPGHFSAVGVYIDAGSRYENDYLRGISHIMDRLAFKSTTKRSGDDMLEAIESLGGNIQCASSRETLMYQAATFNSAVPTTIELLAETIRNPELTEEEVQAQVDTAAYEIGEIWSKPELILPELVHVAAYKDNTLGNPLLCPQERLGEITKENIVAYRKAFYKPDRMVVAFAGVEHDEAVRLTEQHFGDMKSEETPSIASESETARAATATTTSLPPAPPQSPTRLLKHIPFLKNLSTSASAKANVQTSPPLASDFTSPSHYTGGFLSLPPLPPPINPALPALTHIHLAFEAYPVASENVYALATLQVLLGGGGSFSAGGPGKGMYSRLYTNVLNQHGWVESCMAFNHAYTDSGLFGISSSCSPSHVIAMIDVMCRELQSLTLETGYRGLQPIEVARAKNQLRSSLLMNLESRMVELEDLGRQVQVHGRKIGVKEMCERIESLEIKDLRRVAQEVMGGLIWNRGGGSGAPTVVLQEGLEHGVERQSLGWDEIQDRIAKWKLGRR